MLESLAVIVSTSLPLAYGMVMCASERDTARGKNKKKSERSKKGGKSGRSRSKKSTRSRGRSKSRKSKSGKSRKSSKSKKSRKSSKSSRSKKSSRSTRTAKQKSAKLAKDAERKLEKSAKCSTSNNSCKKQAAPAEEKSAAAAAAPNVACNNNNNNNASSRECGAKKSNIAEELRSIKHLKNMSVVPSRLPFASQGGINSIDIKNNSNERKAYKVKCSDNLLYRVNPVFGFAEPNSTTRVDVLRANGEEKMDKLVVITATVNNEKDARSVFTRDGLEHEMMVVPLTVN